ncbi:endonuclease domain-containing protein [Novosphingobium piscinae]|uniref:DUF559 domain-containing protein n=1 Tax=Novosphingobium piscinae TaxID=1507448 RepID=A0A7X1KQ47_9SPHN|nr:DUF559 domain-containing protein [Novosphingobium piscinae]MBC2669389.1 DUF559 domain-containing protein [Novosphingobium piscinae]
MDNDWFRANDKGYSRPTARSRELRRNTTEAERRLWQQLRNRQLRGKRFNRQFPVGQFICDFACREQRLIVELDGGHHAHVLDYDLRRTQFLEAQGYRVIRFWNNEVMENIEAVLMRIGEALDNRPSPGPSRRREGSLWSRSLRSRGSI